MTKTFTDVVMRPKIMEVMRFLLDNPDSDFNQSEITRKVDASYKTVHKVIHQLEEFGVVEKTKRGSSTFIRINQDSPYLEILEAIANADVDILENVARRYTQELVDRVEKVVSVILFGSVARGWPTKNSDIDLLILVEEDTEKVEQKAQSLADKYSREQQVSVSPLVMEEDSFKEELDNKAPLPKRIKKEGKILSGRKPW